MKASFPCGIYYYLLLIPSYHVCRVATSLMFDRKDGKVNGIPEIPSQGSADQ